jgi:hypothetical protein
MCVSRRRGYPTCGPTWSGTESHNQVAKSKEGTLPAGSGVAGPTSQRQAHEVGVAISAHEELSPSRESSS